MFKSFKKIGYYNLVLLCFASLTGGLVWMLMSSKTSPSATLNHYDAFAINITSTQFSNTGEKEYELFSPRLNHYSLNNQIRAEKPELYIYNKEKEAWLITSDYALAIGRMELIQFINHVDITGVLTKGHAKTHVFTERISYFPEKKLATTLSPVTIQQPGLSVTATGMSVDFTTGKIDLLSKITGRYNPNVST